MSAKLDLSIRNLQQVQRENARMIAYLKPRGALGKIVQRMTVRAHRYIVTITHVWVHWGGTYRASQRMGWDGGDTGRLYVDPNARNARKKTPPVEYSIYEEARGGEHAAYARTEAEAMPRIMADAQIEILGALYG